jgi:uncharacterized protein YciW
MNPYHEPTTAAAIMAVSNLPRLRRHHALQLRQLLEDMEGRGSLPAMRRDLMLRLQEAISAEQSLKCHAAQK